jgi:pilus assembly protein CpaE
MIDNVLVTHTSGLKVLIAPAHPEQAYDITGDAVRELVSLLASSYDFIVIDTPTLFDDMTLKLFDIAEKIVLVCNPTIPAIRNTRKMLDIFDNLEHPAKLTDKVVFVLNRVVNEKDRGHGTVPSSSIENHLKLSINSQIPLDERSVLTAVNQGVPLVAKLKSRSPGRELVALAEYIRETVEAGGGLSAEAKSSDVRTKSGIRTLFGGAG